MKNLKAENADMLKHIDDYEVDNDNTTEENVIILEFDDLDEEIIAYFATAEVMKSHICRNC